jgi:hypothetical protein
MASGSSASSGGNGTREEESPSRNRPPLGVVGGEAGGVAGKGGKGGNGAKETGTGGNGNGHIIIESVKVRGGDGGDDVLSRN